MIDKDYIKSYVEKETGATIKYIDIKPLEDSFETRINILYSDNTYEAWKQNPSEEQQDKILKQVVRRYKSYKRKKDYVKTKE